MDILATTHDSIYQGKVTLEQPVNGYRFGSDAMLLAAAVTVENGQNVLELGCGVGAVLLAMHCRFPEARLTGVEYMLEYAALTRKNIQKNNAQQYVTIHEGNVQDVAFMRDLTDQAGMFDHIVANPPYYDIGRHSGASDELRRVARQHDPDALADWLQAANRALKPKGTVTFIHSVEKLDELIVGMKRFCGGIRVFPLWPHGGKSAKRIIVQGVKGSRAPLSLMAGLVTHDEGGTMTPRALDIINHGHSLWSDASLKKRVKDKKETSE